MGVAETLCWAVISSHQCDEVERCWSEHAARDAREDVQPWGRRRAAP